MLSSIPGSPNKALILSANGVRGNPPPSLPPAVYLFQVLPMSGGRYLLVGAFHQTGSINGTIILVIVNGSGTVISYKVLNEMFGDAVAAQTGSGNLQPVAQLIQTSPDIIFIAGWYLSGLKSRGTLIGPSGRGALVRTNIGPMIYSCFEDWTENASFSPPYITGATSYPQQVFGPVNSQNNAPTNLSLSGSNLLVIGGPISSYGNTALTNAGIIITEAAALASQMGQSTFNPGGAPGPATGLGGPSAMCADGGGGWFVIQSGDQSIVRLNGGGVVTGTWYYQSGDDVGAVPPYTQRSFGRNSPFNMAMQGSELLICGEISAIYNYPFFAPLDPQVTQYGIIRFNPSTGLIDPAFNNLGTSTTGTTIGFTAGTPRCLAVDPFSTEIYLGATFNGASFSGNSGYSGTTGAYNGTTVGPLVKLNSSGTLAWSLMMTGSTVGNSVVPGIYSMYAYSGGVVVVGNFASINGVPRQNFAVVNSSGTVL